MADRHDGRTTARRGAVTFRPLRHDDFALLGRWLAAPHVQRFWREPADAAAVEARYGPSVDGSDPTECFIVLDGGDAAVGFAQRYLMADEPAWCECLAVAGSFADAAGIDYLIGPAALTGRGLGPAMIRRLVDDTWMAHRQVTAVVVGVAVDNRRSWRALEKAGFARVWTGSLASDDRSDAGRQHVYVLGREDHQVKAQ